MHFQKSTYGSVQNRVMWRRKCHSRWPWYEIIGMHNCAFLLFRTKAISNDTFIKEYAAQAVKEGRKECPVFIVQAGREPPSFTCNFHGWDSKKAKVRLFPNLESNHKD